ncbi:DUF3820 family protein [Formosa algae]|uniref:Uncharacterized protein (DUF3820 family) n=1 Tax=Formosa algae TaxID=225843 RepID=A0A9X0YPR1_9FLAO|nr:DUF3820 family protein [Formosa algae]MBP1841439.1 uncharacterized protein (DUF3820 family) [Formosa algae]MDQ0336639.1 uncharacterized protein (DUF3820 family) [Formosa algae]OEI81901.1 hypothetical protein AST99_01730 [Formosa algae]
MDQLNRDLLIELAHTKMPFGKYKHRYLIDLPEFYIVWYNNKGFPKGKIGDQLKMVYELKLNGLEDLIRNIKQKYPNPKRIT